ncbi:MAG: GUN4 domain-containing protein [Dolichospermum sp.]
MKFGDKVGWRKGGNWLYYKDITFDKKAPGGHLPWQSGWFFNTMGGRLYVGVHCVSSLASRLLSCNI